jgi:hypothetical protein
MLFKNEDTLTTELETVMLMFVEHEIINGLMLGPLLFVLQVISVM